MGTFALLVSLGLTQASANEAIKKETAKTNIAANSQKKVTNTADKTRDIVDKYRETLRKIENAKVYNYQMRKLIESQEEETVNIRKNIVSLKRTNKEILPFTLRLLQGVKDFVAIDVPFLPEERNKRMATLTALMDKGNVSTSEKFRRVLEAYQIENDYGRSMESYRGLYKVEDKEMTVDYLRVGRIFLGLQSIDGSYSAYYDKASKTWKELPGSYEDGVELGIKIARKTVAPNLIKLPIEKAVAATAASTEVQ